MIYKLFDEIREKLKCFVDIKSKKIVVGLSGGSDSVFLLHFFVALKEELRLKITAAHLNHGWRESAICDEKFCAKLCEKLGVPFVCKHGKDFENRFSFNGSKEEIGRKMRRAFFSETKDEIGADYVALAHHKQDQQETFFMRLARGCGLSGLTGMKRLNGFYLRPLLTIDKKEILEFLSKNKIEYCVDETNFSDAYLRNRIRKQLIPSLEKIDNRFSKKLQSSLETLAEEGEILREVTRDYFCRIFSKKDSDKRWVGCKKTFLTTSSPIQKKIIIEWLCEEQVKFSPSRSHVEEILRFLISPRGGEHEMHSTWSIVKKGKEFWIEQKR